jgi:hypothetical protein
MIRAHELHSDGGPCPGVVLVDDATGRPLPLPISAFTSAEDGELFITWARFYVVDLEHADAPTLAHWAIKWRKLGESPTDPGASPAR